MKTIVIISDTHCGSVYGLTPPEYFQTKRQPLQYEDWEAYLMMVQKWRKPDILLVNGDAIEGNQSKQGGAELITTDRLVQSAIAVDCIRPWAAKKILMTYGSRYHVGEQAEDFEFGIAEKLNATIEGRLYFNLEGMIIDARHKVNTSCIPHGRATALMREMMWDMIRESEEVGPKVDVVIRSHAHYYLWVEQPHKTMFITPSLQLSRGRYGARDCIGETHWGAIRLTIDKDKIVEKDVSVWNLVANKPQVIKIK